MPNPTPPLPPGPPPAASAGAATVTVAHAGKTKDSRCVVKQTFATTIRNTRCAELVEGAVLVMHEFSKRSSQIRKLFMLDVLSNESNEIPAFTQQFILNSFYSVMQQKRERRLDQPKTNQLLAMEQLALEAKFAKLDGTNMAFILSQEAITAATNHNNHLQLFKDHFGQFFNNTIRRDYAINGLGKKELELRRGHLRDLKQAVWTGHETLPQQLQGIQAIETWWGAYRDKLLPYAPIAAFMQTNSVQMRKVKNKNKFSYARAAVLKSSPHLFLRPMYVMVCALERMKRKHFHLLPVVSRRHPGHLALNTAGMLQLLVGKSGENKGWLLANQKSPEARAKWHEFFDINKFRNSATSANRSSLVFANFVQTDGVAISVHYASQHAVEAKDRPRSKTTTGTGTSTGENGTGDTGNSDGTNANVEVNGGTTGAMGNKKRKIAAGTSAHSTVGSQQEVTEGMTANSTTSTTTSISRSPPMGTGNQKAKKSSAARQAPKRKASAISSNGNSTTTTTTATASNNHSSQISSDGSIGGSQIRSMTANSTTSTTTSISTSTSSKSSPTGSGTSAKRSSGSAARQPGKRKVSAIRSSNSSSQSQSGIERGEASAEAPTADISNEDDDDDNWVCPKKLDDPRYVMNASDVIKFLTKDGHWIVVDPGMRDLLHAMGYGGRIFRFSHRHFMFLSKRLKLKEKYERLSNLMFVKGEQKLVGFSCNAVNRDNFLEYMKLSNEVQNELAAGYEDPIFRKLKFRGYSGQQKAHAVMLRDLSRRFGPDVYVAYGDFDKSSNLPGMMSSPVVRTRQLVEKRFRFGLLDEHNTSKIHHKTHQVCGHQYAYDKLGHMRKLYSVLTSPG